MGVSYSLSEMDNEAMEGASAQMVRRIQIAAIAMIAFSLPLIMWPGLTDYNYAKCIVGVIAISIMLALWGFNAWKTEPWTIHVPWVLIPAAGLVIAGAISAVQAANGWVVAQSLILLVAFILLLWMIANVVQDHHDVRRVLIALLASGSLAAIYGILQYTGIVSGSPGSLGVNAIISTMGNRNHLGGFLLYLFYPSMILLLHLKGRWMKALSLVLIALNFVVMILVYQSGTRIVFSLITAMLMLGWLIFRPARCSHTNRRWLAAFASIIVVLCVFFMLTPPGREMHLGSDAIAGESSWIEKLWHANSGEERAWFWWIAADMFADHPITGVGLGNYKINYAMYEADFASTPRGQQYAVSVDRVSQAHSEFVQVGAELGTVGLLMLLCTIGVLAASLWIRLRHTNKHNRLDLILLASGLLAFLIHAFVSFPAHVASSSLELVVFCGLALSPRFGNSMSFSWTIRGWKAKATHGILVLLSIIIVIVAANDLRANLQMERGIAHIQAGQFALGETSLQQSLRLDFAPRQTYYYLAVAQIQLGKLNEAEENLEKCMTRFLDQRVMLTYADLELNLGNLEKAQEAVDMLLASHSEPSIERQTRYIEGVIAVKQQEIDRAIQLLETLTLDFPEYEMGFVALGQIYAAMNMANSAIQNFQTALQLIDGALRSAQDELAGIDVSSSTARSQIRARIDVLRQQRTYLIDELNQISGGH